MPAVPVAVTTLITVSTKLGVLNVTTNTAGLPSVAVGLEMVTVGGVVASTSVAVPEPVVLLVLPEVTVAFNVNVSFGSIVPSVNVGTLTLAVVCPAGIVTVVAVVV